MGFTHCDPPDLDALRDRTSNQPGKRVQPPISPSRIVAVPAFVVIARLQQRVIGRNELSAPAFKSP
jgi:hypothetical protein